jgi:hypothetical protein
MQLIAFVVSFSPLPPKICTRRLNVCVYVCVCVRVCVCVCVASKPHFLPISPAAQTHHSAGTSPTCLCAIHLFSARGYGCPCAHKTRLHLSSSFLGAGAEPRCVSLYVSAAYMYEHTGYDTCRPDPVVHPALALRGSNKLARPGCSRAWLFLVRTSGETRNGKATGIRTAINEPPLCNGAADFKIPPPGNRP